VSGISGATLSLVGQEKDADPVITVPADALQSVRIYVALGKQAVEALPAASTEFSFVVSATDRATSAEHGTIFQGPER
jgi:hypothetical protein